jgi:hypothetical protein
MGYDPQISEQEQLEEAQLAKDLESKPLLAEKDNPEESRCSLCCCFRKRKERVPAGYEACAEGE